MAPFGWGATCLCGAVSQCGASNTGETGGVAGEVVVFAGKFIPENGTHKFTGPSVNRVKRANTGVTVKIAGAALKIAGAIPNFAGQPREIADVTTFIADVTR